MLHIYLNNITQYFKYMCNRLHIYYTYTIHVCKVDVLCMWIHGDIMSCTFESLLCACRSLLNTCRSLVNIHMWIHGDIPMLWSTYVSCIFESLLCTFRSLFDTRRSLLNIHMWIHGDINMDIPTFLPAAAVGLRAGMQSRCVSVSVRL